MNAEELAKYQINTAIEMTIGDQESFFRDANLTEASKRLYRKGIVFEEEGFIDVSEWEGGLAATCRYHIVSSISNNYSASFPNYGAWTIPRGSYFKVLDIHTIGDYTQITLLQIPKMALDYFATRDHEEEAEIVARSRVSFTDNLQKLPVKELSDSYWLRRTEFPLGISDEGTFFYVHRDRTVRPKPEGFLKRLFRRRNR
ncbi:MAG: hypothetical protein U0176_27340 [Bacteroidia bacterium]